MSTNNVEIHQLGPKQLAVVFNKSALAALKNGGATGCQLRMGKKMYKIVFMRDVSFHQRRAEFDRQLKLEGTELTLWQKLKRKLKWQKQ